MAAGPMNLEVFTISRSRVECDGMVELAKALVKWTNLREL
jgi:Ran GTPase-activating protein (RanGAP) involved in mRNA processing and transport